MLAFLFKVRALLLLPRGKKVRVGVWRILLLVLMLREILLLHELRSDIDSWHF